MSALPGLLDALPVRAGAAATPALAETLERARRAPFHRDRLAGARADDWIETVPFTTKDDLRRAYPFGMLAVPRAELESYHESTGTSGHPTSSFFTPRDWDEVADRCARSAADLGREDTLLIKTPYAMVTTAHQMHRVAQRVGATIVPADNRSSNMSLPRVLRLLRDLEVTAAWCLPTEALLWAAACEAAGGDPRTDLPRLRALWIAGEPVSAAKQARTGELFDARALQDFGSTETGSMAGECTEGSLHLWADLLYAEVIGDDGRVRDEGEGELVITTLTREAMPLVRYRLGDHVRLAYGECACGAHLPTIEVTGRSGSELVSAGRPLRAVDVEQSVFSLPPELGVLFFRARALPEGLEVEIERGRATTAGDGEAAAARLRELIAEQLGLPSRVTCVEPGSLVSDEELTADVVFRKPRFLFGPDEPWSTAVTY